MSAEEKRFHKQSNLDFRVMSVTFKLRDLFKPRISILKEVGIEAGFQVLDYGCGPGSYIAPLVDLVGKSGKIYVLDAHPLAIQMVKTLCFKKGLDNVKTILSNCATGLALDSLDVVILYDILHDLKNASEVLAELNRVLKQNGILSVSDHHMNEAALISRVTSGGLFKLSTKGKRTYSFSK